MTRLPSALQTLEFWLRVRSVEDPEPLKIILSGKVRRSPLEVHASDKHLMHGMQCCAKLHQKLQHCSHIQAFSATRSSAHSVEYAHKLVTTRRAIENKTSHSQVLELGAPSNPPDPH
eukprot:1156170-Pelagomonas_calceolata.AAC.1